MKRKLSVLLIDGDEEYYLLTRDILRGISPAGWSTIETSIELHWTQDYEAAVQAFISDEYDAYLVDYQLGDRTGLELINKALEVSCQAPVILLTGQGSYQVDTAAMEAGAADYLVKDEIDSRPLERSIRYAVERNQNQQALRKAHPEFNIPLPSVQVFLRRGWM